MIDLRTDASTRPTPRMRAAIANAEVGNDRYREDPTTNRLEELAAELCGTDAALFVATGTMANAIAARLLLRSFQTVVCEKNTGLYEAGHFIGVDARFRLIPSRQGHVSEDDLRSAVGDVEYGDPDVRLFVLENTALEAGGVPIDVDESAALCAVAKSAGLATYLDGARIFNAAVALGVPARALVEPFDAAMFCLSKGLAAPDGSMLVGSAAFIAEARRVRMALGGQMRQTGLLAAAGIVALEEMIPRLAEDHARARELSKRLAEIEGVRIDRPVMTNMVFAQLAAPIIATDLTVRLASQAVLVLPHPGNRLRLVTHVDIDDRAVDVAVEAIGTAVADARISPSGGIRHLI